MSITCKFNGRLGNILFNMGQVIAHAKQHNLQYAFPKEAWACTGGVCPITVQPTGPMPFQPMVYHEPVDPNGQPYYHEIPVRDNIIFHGYYQSFKYIDPYRQDILDGINMSWEHEAGVCAVHLRLGDCIGQEQAFPIAPKEYYDIAIQHMMDRGFTRFRLFSDSISKVRGIYNETTYPGTIWEYREGHTDVEDFINMSGCEAIITARSTFSLMAAWFNRHEDKQVCIPDGFYWKGQNRDLLPDYWTRISFNKLQDIYE